MYCNNRKCQTIFYVTDVRTYLCAANMCCLLSSGRKMLTITLKTLTTSQARLNMRLSSDFYKAWSINAEIHFYMFNSC